MKTTVKDIAHLTINPLYAIIEKREKVGGVSRTQQQAEEKLEDEINLIIKDLADCIVVLKSHIEQTESDFNYNGTIVPKSDVLKYIHNVLNE